ncbi:MAG: alpha-amylase family glycosyl hydrolase [Verrucomicrobiaceae bacterium]
MSKLCVLALLLLSGSVSIAQGRSWQDEVIYFMMVDRFYDGDPYNNLPKGCDPATYDPKQENIDLYHGGDFRGIELALQSGYFNDLGITAIWITPPVRNVWKTAYDEGDSGKTGYHGYWTQDFLDVDPHLTSRVSLRGEAYSNNRYGRLAHYRDLVKLAHEKGIRIIQDVVCNHVGPLFFYDQDKDGTHDTDNKDEWVAPFKHEGFHETAKWGHIPKWNIFKPEPSEPKQIFGKTIACNGILADIATYSRKGFDNESLSKADGEEIDCDFFSLRDVWTKGGSAHFDELVDEFVRIYAFYIEEVGIDGLRIDTVKHVHHEFWSEFSKRLREKVGEKADDLILFGEVYDGNPRKLGQYTYRHDNQDVALDSLLNFEMCWSARNYLRHEKTHFGHADGIQRAMENLHSGPPGELPYYNAKPGRDGLNSRQKSITFLENHDGINRFRVKGVTEKRNILANALVLTLEGIPCLYYGTEASLIDNQATTGDNAETGRMTFIRRGDGSRVKRVRSTKSFQGIKSLIQARKDLPALRIGEANTLWVDQRQEPADDGLFIFARYIPGQPEKTVIVGFNLGDKPNHFDIDIIGRNQEDILPQDAQLTSRPILGIEKKTAPVNWGETPRASLDFPKESMVIWTVE